jgi:hypothetical protein
MIASLITQHKGEYVLRLGTQPPPVKLFSGEPLDDFVPWTGTGRNFQELETLQRSVTAGVEEIGGKVRFCFFF